MDQLSLLRVRLADLTELRAAYENMGKRHLASYLDHVLAEMRADIVILERQAAAGPPLADEPFSTPQDANATVKPGALG